MCAFIYLYRQSTESQSDVDNAAIDVAGGRDGNNNDDDDNDDDCEDNVDEQESSVGLQPPAQRRDGRVSTAVSDDSAIYIRPSVADSVPVSELYGDVLDKKPTKNGECEGARNRKSLADILNAGFASVRAMSIGRDSESASSSAGKVAMTEYIR